MLISAYKQGEKLLKNAPKFLFKYGGIFFKGLLKFGKNIPNMIGKGFMLSFKGLGLIFQGIGFTLLHPFLAIKNILKVGMKGITAFIKLIKTPIMRALIIGMFYLTMIVLVVSLITKVVWPALKGAFETFMEFSGILISGFMSIWDGVREVFTSLIEGDLLGVMNGLLEIAWGLVKVVFGLLVAVLAGIISFVVNFALVIYNKTIEFGKKLIANPVKTIKDNIGKIALVALALLGFFFGLPVMLAGIAIFALFAIGRWIYNKIAGLFDYFAEGGVSSGGMAVVGEKGPELVNLPRGSRVHSNKESRKMVSSGGGNTINVTVNATSTNDAELRKIAQKVAQMINREVNRTTSSSMSR